MDLSIGAGRLHASTGGLPFDPEKPALVFIHGAGMDHTVWAMQTRYFAHHGYSVLALDLPGHGRSEGEALASVAELADCAVEALRAAGGETAVFVGHSMGALTALEAVVRHPEAARGLVLAGAAPAMPVHPDMLAAAKANDHAAIDMINAWGHGPSAHLGGNPAPGLWWIGGGNRLLERAKPGVIHTDLAACNDYARGLEAAGEVACPVLMILGEDDKMTPVKAGRKLADALTAAPAVAVEILGCGHMMMTEEPRKTMLALRGFLEGLS
jgi:pimeloyl-ACP methyl ester carboxylesterase